MVLERAFPKTGGLDWCSGSLPAAASNPNPEQVFELAEPGVETQKESKSLYSWHVLRCLSFSCSFSNDPQAQTTRKWCCFLAKPYRGLDSDCNNSERFRSGRVRSSFLASLKPRGLERIAAFPWCFLREIPEQLTQ